MSDTYWVLYQSGYNILGVGESIEECYADAKQWLDPQDRDGLEEQDVPRHDAVDGSLIMAECSQELYNGIKTGSIDSSQYDADSDVICIKENCGS